MFGSQAGLSSCLLWVQVVLIRMLNTTDPLSAGLYGIINTLLNLSVNIYLGVGVAATTLVGSNRSQRASPGAKYRQQVCALCSCVLP